jgi:tetratricopeptide (TPR) repeat protein
MVHAPQAAPRNTRRFDQMPWLAVFCFSLIAVAQSNASAQSKPSTQRATSSRTGDAEVRFNQGRIAMYEGRLTDARANFASVIETNPDDAEAHDMLGLALLEGNDTAGALAEFDESLRLDPDMSAARAGRATALTKLNRFDEAQQEVTILQVDPLSKSTGDFLAGQIEFARHDYAGASQSFGAASDSGGPEAGAAGFYKGVSELQLKHTAAAQSAFRTAADLDPNSSFSLASRQMDALVAAQEKRDRRWSFELQTGYEYDSNVVLLDNAIQLPGNISRRDDGREILQAHASYSFIKNDKWEAGIDTTNYFAWQNSLSDFDGESYDVGAYGSYQIRPNLYAGLRYDFNYVNIGHDPFLTRNLVTPQLTLIEPNFGYTSGYYQFEARQFNGPTPSRALDRDGHNNVVGIVQGIDLPSLFKDTGPSMLELSGRYENQQTSGSDFDGNFYSLGATYHTPLPIWKLRADVGVGVDWQEYSHGNSLDVNRDHRSDFEWRTLVGITKEICPNASVRVDYSYTNHDSNVSTSDDQHPYSYDRHIVGVRLIVTY